MLLFTTLLLATSAVGTVAYAANRARHRRNEPKPSTEHATMQEETQTIISPTADREDIDHFFAVSSVSLGLTMGSVLFHPLLGVSIPLNLYATYPTARDAWFAWRDNKRINAKTLESTLVLGTMATQHFLSAAAINWAYYFSRKLKYQARSDFRSALQKVTDVQTREIWVEYGDTDLRIPLSKVAHDDVIVLHEYDIVPFAGRVVEGAGTINTFLTAQNIESIDVEAGDMVPHHAFVISGTLRVRVALE